MPKLNRAQRVLAFLERHPHVWIDAVRFEPLGGRQAWRTALSEARKIAEARGGKIENRTRTIKAIQGGWVLSEYRYVPPVLSQPSLLAVRALEPQP